MKSTSWLGSVCWLLGVTLSLGMTTTATAGIIIEGTRVIYPSNEREVTVRVQNDGEMPSLVQTWIDGGDAAARPETTRVPFVVTPPLFRMEPKQGQSLRIIHTGESLAENKESIFWLSVLELPPKRTADSDENLIQMAFRTRIKLFYRPAALNKSENISKAQAGLQWKLAPGKDRRMTLEVSNPSPYYITVVNASLQFGEKSIETEDGTMINPEETAILLLKEGSAIPLTADLKIKYNAINDFGALIPFESSIGK